MLAILLLSSRKCPDSLEDVSSDFTTHWPLLLQPSTLLLCPALWSLASLVDNFSSQLIVILSNVILSQSWWLWSPPLSSTTSSAPVNLSPSYFSPSLPRSHTLDHIIPSNYTCIISVSNTHSPTTPIYLPSSWSWVSNSNSPSTPPGLILSLAPHLGPYLSPYSPQHPWSFITSTVYQTLNSLEVK